MFRTYFKTAFRNLWQNRSFTFINIAGLAVGVAVCVVIFLIIQFEQSFDNFHPKKENIYRVISKRKNADGERSSAGVPFPYPTMMHSEFPNIVSTGINQGHNEQIIIPSEIEGAAPKKFKEETGFFYVEPTFFNIFSFPILAGDYSLLKDPNTAVLSKSTAEKYFGDWRLAIGKTFKQNATDLFKIVGVMKDFPDNTDFHINIAASYATLKSNTTSDDWISIASNHGFYMLLPEGMSAKTMNTQLAGLVKKYMDKESAATAGQVVENVAAVHYNDNAGNFSDRAITKKKINVLWLIAAFILLIACVNFINLSTAQAFNRAKEVAVRKVLGGNKAQLRIQFFSETAIITIAAVVLSLLIAWASAPLLGSILDLPLKLDLAANPIVLLFLLVIAIAVILLAGSYPALVLSRFNPVTALKSKVKAKSSKGITLRRSLVVFQFVIAQALIIGTLVIVQQMDYFKNHAVGFSRNAIVNIGFPQDSISKTKLDYLRNSLLDIKGIKSVSFSYASPADNSNWSSDFKYDHAEKSTDWSANLKWADSHYVETYGLQLIAGRNLEQSDTVREYLVNETLLKRLGVATPQEALNKEINLWDQWKYKIVGVVKDFNAKSLREAVVPVLISTQKDFYGTAGLKLESTDMHGTLAKVEKLWNQVYPDFVYEQSFLDAKIAGFYRDENRLSQLYKVFAILAIFLSCLGLYGLASFMAIQKVKEVGIRKVLGASINSIVLLFSKEFILLIGIAFLIAAPLAYYFMHAWLEDFVYRISISWWILLLSGIIAIIIALITISVKAIRAALANPVKSLRSE
jgi:putative ABC transport system permease protein